jgi:hypothetical protein
MMPGARQSISDADLTSLDDRDILALVHTGSRRLDRQIRFRDWRELIAGVIVAALIAPAAARGPVLSRIGAIVVLAGVALVMFRLWRAWRPGSASGTDPSLPVSDALRAELRRLDAQIALLESVGWWYVTPLLGGSVLLVAGVHAARAPWFTLAYTIFAALLGWGIIRLNAYAVRHALRPKRDELSALLAQLES